jgi:hypothetical protein
MRTLTLLASGVLAGVSAAGPAGAQPSVWQGNLFITSVTQACTTSGAAAVGDYFTAVYRPSIPPPGEEFMGIYGETRLGSLGTSRHAASRPPTLI